MKKKLFTTLATTLMFVFIVGCNTTNDSSPLLKSENKVQSIEKDTENIPNEVSLSNTRQASDYDNSTLESILTGIETDFSNTIQYLSSKLNEVNEISGTSYEDYIENKHFLANWYELAIKEENSLFSRTEERAIEYFKLITSTIPHNDDDAIDDAMDDFYDKVYDGVMDDFYDDIYDDLMDDIYDAYYNGILEDGYDIAPYEKWNDECSEYYKTWSDASSTIYKIWSTSSSNLYKCWSAVSSGFYKNNFDVDNIIEEYKITQEKIKENVSTSLTETGSSENNSTTEQENTSFSDEIRPEFQEAMDSYETFFDEYVSFMNEYLSSDTDDMLNMMTDYNNYLNQYAETMEKFSALKDSDLSQAEALYYAEVSNRISIKMLELTY